MTKWKTAKPEELEENAFQMVGKDWMLITAAKPDGTVNTMTASWGGMGILWNHPVAFLFIRPQRYTREFVDASEGLSLTFFDEKYRKMLAYMGRVSGRDEDKIGKMGLTVAWDGKVPYFEEARVVLKCRKLYRKQLDPACFTETEDLDRCYPDKDYSILYVAAVEEVKVKTEGE